MEGGEENRGHSHVLHARTPTENNTLHRAPVLDRLDAILYEVEVRARIPVSAQPGYIARMKACIHRRRGIVGQNVRVRARVVDFFPDDLRNCTVMRCTNCNQKYAYSLCRTVKNSCSIDRFLQHPEDPTEVH